MTPDSAFKKRWALSKLDKPYILKQADLKLRNKAAMKTTNKVCQDRRVLF